METLKDVFETELKDLYSAENQLLNGRTCWSRSRIATPGGAGRIRSLR